MGKNIKTEQMAEIIVDAIIEEPFFSKETLIPKIKALVNGFRLGLSTANYNKTDNPTEVGRLVRQNELHNWEKDFWKQELKTIVGVDNMQNFYDKLDERRKIWNNTKT